MPSTFHNHNKNALIDARAWATEYSFPKPINEKKYQTIALAVRNLHIPNISLINSHTILNARINRSGADQKGQVMAALGGTTLHIYDYEQEANVRFWVKSR